MPTAFASSAAATTGVAAADCSAIFQARASAITRSPWLTLVPEGSRPAERAGGRGLTLRALAARLHDRFERAREKMQDPLL